MELEIAERRKQDRFKIKDDAYIYSASTFTFVGKVIDISRSGLAFSCGEYGDSTPIKIDDLGILISKKNSISENLPFQIVSNETIVCSPVNNIVMKRWGGRFLSLTPGQKGELEGFITKYTKQDYGMGLGIAHELEI